MNQQYVRFIGSYTHQPKKSLSFPVGASGMLDGLVSLYGRPLWAVLKRRLQDEWTTSTPSFPYGILD